MSTNEIHPYVRRYQQFRKMFFRTHKKKMPHHNRKWWKAWHKTWEYDYKKMKLEQMKE